jgi:hypothetical protein
VQIQTSYSSNPYLSSAALNSEGQNQTTEISKTESPEYRTIRNEAALILGNPNISALEKARALTLLARGESAASDGATAELLNLSRQMEQLDLGLSVKGNSFQKGASSHQGTSNQKDEGNVTYQDVSGDTGVSFKYPVDMNKYEAPIAVSAHEEEHVIAAQARAMMNNESVTTYVSIHSGYDNKGRLYVTGGTTTAIYHPKPKMEPIVIGKKVNTYV